MHSRQESGCDGVIIADPEAGTAVTHIDVNDDVDYVTSAELQEQEGQFDCRIQDPALWDQVDGSLVYVNSAVDGEEHSPSDSVSSPGSAASGDSDHEIDEHETDEPKKVSISQPAFIHPLAPSLLAQPLASTPQISSVPDIQKPYSPPPLPVDEAVPQPDKIELRININTEEPAEVAPNTPQNSGLFVSCCCFSSCFTGFFSPRNTKKPASPIELKSMSNKPEPPASPVLSSGLHFRG